MKKISVLTMALMSAGMSFSGAVEARKKFEADCSGAFARSHACPCEVAPASLRFDKAADKASYVIALPYSDDDRLRFIDAQFEGGKFVSAKIKVFGFEPKVIGEKEFEALREDFPMVAIKVGTSDVNSTACLYTARKTKMTRQGSNDKLLAEDPVGTALGSLRASIGRVGVGTGKLAYNVKFKAKDGTVVDLGIATTKIKIGAKEVFAAFRDALERKMPGRKGMISDRDVIDFRHDCEVVYTPVMPPAPDKGK